MVKYCGNASGKGTEYLKVLEKFWFPANFGLLMEHGHKWF